MYIFKVNPSLKLGVSLLGLTILPCPYIFVICDFDCVIVHVSMHWHYGVPKPHVLLQSTYSILQTRHSVVNDAAAFMQYIADFGLCTKAVTSLLTLNEV